MKSWPLWISGLFVLALIVHITTVFAVPHVIMDRTISAVSARGAINMVQHVPRATAMTEIKRAAPDLLYSICIFDLSDGPLRIISPIPDTYWSLSIFASDTNNFFTLNDKQANANQVKLLLALEGQELAGMSSVAGSPVIVAPSSRGIAIFRTFIDSEKRSAELDLLRRQASCTPLQL